MNTPTFRRRTLGFISVCGMLIAASTVHADLSKCQQTVVGETARLMRGEARALAGCELKRVKGSLPVATDCRTELKTAATLQKLRGKIVTAIGKVCGGVDKRCGGDATGELGSTAIGFGASCPAFGGSSCPATLDSTTCAGVAECLACIGARTVDQAIAVFARNLRPTDRRSQAVLNNCQQAIVRTTGDFLARRSKALQKCWDDRLRGKHLNACPDPGNGKTGAALAAAQVKLEQTICKACGGKDKVCGTADDLTPLLIGFRSPCLDATIPGGPTCAGPVASVDNVIACAGCVTSVAVDCTDRAAVPAFAAYPPECVTVPTPTPTATPTATATPLAARDWSSAFTAWWSLDEATGIRRNQAGPGSCGGSAARCDLKEAAGIVGISGIDPREGLASAAFDGSGPYLFGRKSPIFRPTDAITFGGWARVADESGNRVVIHNLHYLRSGYELTYFADSDRLTCKLGNYTTLAQVEIPDPNVAGSYAFAVCTWDGATVRAYGNGQPPKSASLPSFVQTLSTFNLGMPARGVGPMIGDLDEIGYVGGRALTESEICRWCSCGIRGEQCGCQDANPSQYLNTGRNASACHSCALPACDAPPPG